VSLSLLATDTDALCTVCNATLAALASAGTRQPQSRPAPSHLRAGAGCAQVCTAGCSALSNMCSPQHSSRSTHHHQRRPRRATGHGQARAPAWLQTLAQANPDPGAPTASAPAARCHTGVASATEAAAGASARAPGAPGAASVPPRTCQRGARARPSARPAARPPRWPAGGL
jgi:hypothetical protein